MRLVAAPDKFRGTASARDIAGAIAAAAVAHGWEAAVVPMADGGEGTLDVFGGPNRTTLVTGPLGDPVEAPWRLDRDRAVVEMAAASGLLLAGGAEGNDPIAATTAGTGELLVAALEAGATRVVVGLGGSATTDGGYGAVRAMEPLARFRRVRIEVACDVQTRFEDAAEVFGPQKGASPAQVRLLARRLQRLVQVYRDDFGVDVAAVDGGGAAGGLAGGLAAVGARLVPGVPLVAEEVGLMDELERCHLVVVGEGRLDATSFEGKVVGGVAELARIEGLDVLAVCGQVDHRDLAVPDHVTVVSLAERFGPDRAHGDPCGCVTEAVGEFLDLRVAKNASS